MEMPGRRDRPRVLARCARRRRLHADSPVDARSGPRPVRARGAPVPERDEAALRRLAEELGLSLGSVLLAAHAKVLAALSGEREVVTGYAVPGGQPLPVA